MQDGSTTKATLELARRANRRAKGKKKRGQRVNDVQVAETPLEFSFTIARTAVSQICQSVGYKRSQCVALEALTNVTTKYLEAISKSAASFANASNRTDSNLFDLINGIHDLCSVRGFPGGSKMHTSSNLLSSAALKEIVDFVKVSKKVPFSKPIPSTNAYESQNQETSIDLDTSIYCSKNAKIHGLHIPGWLPDFPSESLYKKCDQVLVKERRCGEKLWEESLAMEDCSGNMEANSSMLKINNINEKEEEKDTKMKLAKGRERVKFKIGMEEEKQIGLGMNMMNGVCKGRKRVSWSDYKINNCMSMADENDERDGLKG